jgi:hypothetical protein
MLVRRKELENRFDQNADTKCKAAKLSSNCPHLLFGQDVSHILRYCKMGVHYLI